MLKSSHSEGTKTQKKNKTLFEYLSFNERFQIVAEKLKSTKVSNIETASDMMINVAEDFLWSARTYGKIIISEYKLPDHLKTIKPCLGEKGRLGGTKYLHKGKLIFQFFNCFLLFFPLFNLLVSFILLFLLIKIERRSILQTCRGRWENNH